MGWGKKLLRARRDIATAPLTWMAAIWLKRLREIGLVNRPSARHVLRQVGVLPVRDHYYEPLINPSRLRRPLDEPRPLPGIDFNDDEQLTTLARFSYQSELNAFPLEGAPAGGFQYHNRFFESGDAEYLYCVIRSFRPRFIVEAGSGHSTLIAREAIARNSSEDGQYVCRHICIEPYENPWLAQSGVDLIREPVEEVDRATFGQLSAGDIFFIDSSHMIRPQGDVLAQLLEIIPQLRSGVLVHLHDIFTPRDYPASWIIDDHRLWNEQYLLEAFLTLNCEFRIIGALNYLKHRYPEELARALPVLGREMQREPGSFWMQRV